MGNSRYIYNGKIVTPDGIIDSGAIMIEDDTIADIQKKSTGVFGQDDMDAKGMWILPGLIDTHSDAIELEIQPRPSSVMPVSSAFYELERKLAGQGITTMYHSLSMYYTENNGNWVRRNKNIEYIIKQIYELTKEKSLIRNKIHLRYEMRNKEGYSIVKSLIENKSIDQVSLMDHTPGKGQWHDVAIQKQKIMKQLDLTSEEADKHIEELQQDSQIDFDSIQRLAEIASLCGIPLASHDDDSIEKIDLVQSWKAAISEFPITIDIAEEAKKRGIHVVMGAPNLLLGRSHNNNLSALEAIRAGVVDILCSDYYPGSLLQGIFHLYELGYDLPEVVNMATLNPAKALGIADSLGSIEIGKKADLILISAEENVPKLIETIVDGETVSQVHYRNHLINHL